MPAELWSEAATAARHFGVYAVARAVGVDYGALARRLAEGAGPAMAVDKGQAVGFVEWSGAQILGTSTAAGPVVELSDGAGRQMTIRLGGGEILDVAALVVAFCGQQA
jgi:hypothetical protein